MKTWCRVLSWHVDVSTSATANSEAPQQVAPILERAATFVDTESLFIDALAERIVGAMDWPRHCFRPGKTPGSTGITAWGPCRSKSIDPWRGPLDGNDPVKEVQQDALPIPL